MVELTEGSKVRILMNFEYFPMDKVMSVPAEETAFLRKRFGNVLSIVRWDDNTIENFEFARSASHQLTGIATKANSEVTDPHFYSNYGESIRDKCQYQAQRKSRPRGKPATV